MMIRLISQLLQAFRSERGSATPTLVLMSSVLAISGGAFMTVAVQHEQQMQTSIQESHATSEAEREVQRTLWRIGHTDPDSWDQWASVSDSLTTAAFDSATGLLTVTATVGTITDTIKVYVNYDPIPSDQIDHLMAYTSEQYGFGDLGETSYQPGYEPAKVDAKAKMDWGTYLQMADYTYDYDQVFDGQMADGLHVVSGVVWLMPGTKLNGSIVALHGITAIGDVEVTAGAATDSSYYPALASAQGWIVSMPTIDEEEVWAYYEALYEGDDLRTAFRTLFDIPDFHGVLFSKRGQQLMSTDVDGMLIGEYIYLYDAYTLSYNAKYMNPPPGMTLWPERYQPVITEWIEEEQTGSGAPPTTPTEYSDTQVNSIQ
jgi:hypothetical protein